VQYCVARAALDGEVRLDHFEGDAWRDAAVQSLLPRVVAAPYGPEQFSVAEFPFGAEVKITLTNGNSVSSKVDRPLGRTSGNPIAPAQMQEKFADCARRVLTAETAAAAHRMMAAFEDVDSVTRLTALLDPGAVRRAQ
jgi:2-methylcitrate dehydratase PrpD